MFVSQGKAIVGLDAGGIDPSDRTERLDGPASLNTERLSRQVRVRLVVIGHDGEPR